MKTKIKPHGDKATDFHDKKIPTMVSNHTRLAVTTLDSALNKDGNYSLQIFLKVCKYIEKKTLLGIFMKTQTFFQ